MDQAFWTGLGIIIGGILTTITGFMLKAKKMDADALAVIAAEHTAAVKAVSLEMAAAVTTFAVKLSDLEKLNLACVEEKAGLKVEKVMLQVQVDKLEKRVEFLEKANGGAAGNY